MPDSLEILGKDVPLYGLCFFGGIALAALAAFFIVKKTKIFPLFDLTCSAVYVMIGAMIGAKLLFVAVSIEDIIELKIPLVNVIKGGFVFYGGLIGGLLGLFIYAKQFKMSFSMFLELYSVVLPLGHSLGRVGCFFGGCCYGMEYDGPFSVVYTETVGMTPLNVELLPIQLIEALGLLLLFFLLLILYFKARDKISCVAVYAILYSLMRFILEFFRGDAERGVFFGVSTSQIISIGLFVFGLFATVKKASLKNKIPK